MFSNEPISLHAHNARERVRAIYAALYHAPGTALFDQLDPGLVWELCGPERLPFAGVYLGRDGVAVFLDRLAAAVEPPRFEMRDFVASGERVVAIGVQRGLARATGRVFQVSHMHLWELAEGRVKSFRGLCDTAALCDALGV